MAFVRHYVFFRVACINGGLVDFDPLFGKLGALEAAYQFFCLSGEHGAANDFDSAPALGFLYMIFRE